MKRQSLSALMASVVFAPILYFSAPVGTVVDVWNLTRSGKSTMATVTEEIHGSFWNPRAIFQEPFFSHSRHMQMRSYRMSFEGREGVVKFRSRKPARIGATLSILYDSANPERIMLGSSGAAWADIIDSYSGDFGTWVMSTVFWCMCVIWTVLNPIQCFVESMRPDKKSGKGTKQNGKGQNGTPTKKRLSELSAEEYLDLSQDELLLLHVEHLLEQYPAYRTEIEEAAYRARAAGAVEIESMNDFFRRLTAGDLFHKKIRTILLERGFAAAHEEFLKSGKPGRQLSRTELLQLTLFIAALFYLFIQFLLRFYR